LNPSLYGLKQSSLEWYKKIKQVLIDYGFAVSKHDPALFVKGKGATFHALTLYVDDMLSYGSFEDRAKLNSYLQNTFKSIKVQDDPKDFTLLGVSYRLHKEALFASLPHFSAELVQEFGVTGKTSFPFRSRDHSLEEVCVENGLLTESQIKVFRRGVAKLLYLCSHTRVDLKIAV
jgi:hypothetical protein